MATDPGKPTPATPAKRWSKFMAYLRRLWTDVRTDVSDADVRDAETLTHEVRQRHGNTEATPPSAPPTAAPANADSPATTLSPQYRSTPDPSFGSRSLAQRRERERLQRELIEAETAAAQSKASHRPPASAPQPPPGIAPERHQATGRPDA
jgi:hypothetical protein